MREEVREFVIAQLQDMNYDVEGIDDDTTLGPAGVDLESLALADLSIRVEDKFGVRFSDEESEQLALMTVGEFTTEVAAPGRAEVIDWLSGLGDRAGELERIDSMELAWLVHQVEQRYGVELGDEYLDRIKTIDDAVAVLAEVLPSAATPEPVAGGEPGRSSHG
jgi:acyl carrier protein